MRKIGLIGLVLLCVSTCSAQLGPLPYKYTVTSITANGAGYDISIEIRDNASALKGTAIFYLPNNSGPFALRVRINDLVMRQAETDAGSRVALLNAVLNTYNGGTWVTGSTDTGGTGPQGPQGPAGNDGAQGPQGVPGTNGTNGTNGAQGPPGNDGATGAQGTQGIQGVQGPAGVQGPTGLPFRQFTIGASGAAVCTWTNLVATYVECPSQISRTNLDLSGFTDFRVLTNFSAAAVAGDMQIHCADTTAFSPQTLLYQLDNPAANALVVGTWTVLPAGCKTVGGGVHSSWYA